MQANQILDKAQKLREISNDLSELAERNEPLSDALTLMSSTVCRSAIMLEVLVALKLGHPSHEFGN